LKELFPHCAFKFTIEAHIAMRENRTMPDTDGEDDHLWSVVKELSRLRRNGFKDALLLDQKATLEDCLGRVLRPHDDAGFAAGDQEIVVLRRRLDEALETLTFREIRRELGLKNQALPNALIRRFRGLFRSDAFLRYVNAYLYFGIRFVPKSDDFLGSAPQYNSAQYDEASPSGKAILSTDAVLRKTASQYPETNQVPFPLEPPPPLTNVPNAKSSYEKLVDLWNRQSTGSEKLALEFLDDVHVEIQAESTKPEHFELEVPSEFELWLRGLHPELNNTKLARFEKIRDGLTAWALNRAEFYLRLDKDNHPDQHPVNSDGKEQGRQHRTQDNQVRTPTAARLALNDLYWIARLLGADVSSNGWVRYEKNNWLHLLQFNAELIATERRAVPKEGQHERGEAEMLGANRPASSGEKAESQRLRDAEETLRSVFDSVLNLIQNSIDYTVECPEKGLPETTWQWRAVFDEELDEIECQRQIRHFRDPSLPSEIEWETARTRIMKRREQNRVPDPWSLKVRGELRPEDLIGLAFSGGGIRSATLNLGVLQGLQELDLLRHCDYVSTVSGGGFIGSWLLGNVRRSLHWLGRKTDWSKSIKHLRDYSNYLAPRTGVLSADTWNLANSWLRNTFLIQVTGIAWLFALLMAAILCMRTFLGLGAVHLPGASAATYLVGAAGAVVVLAASYYLLILSRYARQESDGRVNQVENGLVDTVERIAEWFGKHAMMLRAWLEHFRASWPRFGGWLDSHLADRLKTIEDSKDRLASGAWVVRLGVVPAWITGWALAATLWAHAPLQDAGWYLLTGVNRYSELLETAFRCWWLILAGAYAGFCILAFNTLRWSKPFALVIGFICTAVLYLEIVAIFYLFRIWADSGDLTSSVGFVFGPAMVQISFAVCVLLLIGFTGRRTTEAQREWWTRFGTWLGIFTGVAMFVSAVAVFGPWLVMKFLDAGEGHHFWIKSVKWTSVAGSLGTVLGGLLAGNSSKTGGQTDASNSPKLEILARVGGLLFILGSFLVGSALLYVLLFEMFGPDYAVGGSNPLHTFCALSIGDLLGSFVCVCALGLLFSWFFEINIFGLSQFYRNRLVRCYLGATRWVKGHRKPNEFTKFDFLDDLGLWRLQTNSPGEYLPREDDDPKIAECTSFRGPFPIINCSLNLAGSADLALNTRHGACFTLTPLRCGSDRPRVGYAPTVDYIVDNNANALHVGNTPMTNRLANKPSVRACGGFANGIQLGQAVAVSGAAVSSNMGYNTSPLVSFLLTMFNVRLGWWMPNPGKGNWKQRSLNFSLRYLTKELFGVADDRSKYVNVTDGGHFENLAIYELVRRRCKLIIACDAECDELMQFGGLGKMIRLCQTDFGAVIDLDVKSLRPQENGYSLAHCAVGVIKYCTGEIGYLIYLKASMTGDEDVSIAQYRSTHPSFPHESTANQFYSEDQFESYRMLGLHMVRKSFQGNLPGDDPLMIAEKMFDVLTPAGPPSDKFLVHAKTLMDIWEKFRASEPASGSLLDFMHELMTVAKFPLERGPIPDGEMCIGLELIQLMENVFLDLRLDDFWEHPDNRGWAILFMRWARSPRFRRVWNSTRRTFGIRFEYFCSARLGLVRDTPIIRV
jgi:hypothetical protein